MRLKSLPVRAPALLLAIPLLATAPGAHAASAEDDLDVADVLASGIDDAELEAAMAKEETPL